MTGQSPSPISWVRNNYVAATLIGVLGLIIVGLLVLLATRDSETDAPSSAETGHYDPYAPDTSVSVGCDNFSEYIVNEATQDQLCGLLAQPHSGDQTLLALMRQDGPYLDYTGLSASEQVAVAKHSVELTNQGWNESDLASSLELGFGFNKNDALSLVILAQFVYGRPSS